MAETVMMELAKTVGRQQAHDIVHRAAGLAATTTQNFSSVLGADPAVTDRLTTAQIDALLDPAAHTGSSALIAKHTAGRARAAITHRAADGDP